MFGLPNLMSNNKLFAFLIVAIIAAILVWYFAYGKKKCEKKKSKSETKALPQEKEENQEDQEIQDLADEINSD